MKKNLMFAMFGAIALTGSVGLSACSESEDVVDVNPTFDGEAVKTQFTISFPSNVAKTRQTAATVQEAQTIASFRGMDNIVLYPFAATGAANSDPINYTNPAEPNPSTLPSKLGVAITLSKMLKPTVEDVTNSIPATGLTANNNSVLFNDVVIPIGTGSFLFYGKAIDATPYTAATTAEADVAKADANNKFYNGSLIMTGEEPSTIAFNLDQINSGTVSSVGTALATYLTSIAQATGWSTCGEGTGLGDLYKKFITLKAGSSLTVQAAVQDLYESVWKNTDDVSKAIATAITNSTYASADATTGALTFTATLGNSDATYFPGDVNLPDGAACLGWDTSTSPNSFIQLTEGNGNTGPKVEAKYADYVYPASLYYYCNSGIGTATTSQATQYVDTNEAWTNVLTGHYTLAQQVKSDTRSVAILDPIQYAVGRLDMTVAKLPNVKMYDKKGEEYNASAGFEVTGVLIGGQKEVKYDFTTNTSSSIVKTIYDNIKKSQPNTSTTPLTVTTSDGSEINHTLALETAPHTSIFVAVEFLNNGADFEGADGVIPSGCKFYLVGKLDPSGNSDAKTQYTDDENSFATGVTKTGNRVFKQDFITTANFSIARGTEGTANSKGLGAAYNTIPDLRTPQLELGLSVDLKWQNGIQFDVEF